MLSFDDYVRCDALGLAEGVRRGDWSAAELLQAATARIEAVDPALGALTRRRFDAAQAEIGRVDPAAPFAGVPFLVKDLLATLAGEPTGCGNRLLARMPMPRDSEMVRRWRAAGVVIAGRTNTPEFGLMPVTEPQLTGATRNPWDLARTPGGSSGGSAAAVAAGMVPLASGGDGGGSIRIPASCCGLFGLKPSRGMTPTGPELGELWHGLAIEHVLSRSVRDSAAMLDATRGADPGAPYAAPSFERPLLQEVGRDPGRLRIGFTSRPLMGAGPVHDDCVAALDDAACLLASLGHEVSEVSPDVEPERHAIDFITVVAAETWAQMALIASMAGLRAPRAADHEPATFAMGLLGRATPASEYAAAAFRLQVAARRLAASLAGVDLLMTPTLGMPPPPAGALQPTPGEAWVLAMVTRLRAGWLLRAAGAIEPMAAKTFGFIPFTALFNATGQPAMSVPLHWNAAGLPIGIQFVAPLAGEPLLLRLASQLEQARPWFDRRPPEPAAQAATSAGAMAGGAKGSVA